MKYFSFLALALILAGAGCAGGGSADVNTSTGNPSAGVEGAAEVDLGQIAVRNGELVYALMLAGGEMRDSWEVDMDAATSAAATGDYQEAARLMSKVNAEIEAEIEALEN